MKRERTWLWLALSAVAIGAGVSVAGALAHPTEQAFAYLAAFGFVASTVVGALALLAMTYVVGARWFVVLRRLCLTLVTPALVLPALLLPVAFELHTIYPWAGSPLAGPEAITAARRAQAFGHVWMSSGPFLLRAAVYLVVWLFIAEALRRAARAQDHRQNSWFLANRSAVSAAALPALGLTGSWAAFDWLMSAVAGWNMTSVGLYVLIGGFASALGVLAVLVDSARRHGILPKEVSAAHSLALGRLLFAAVCLWAYIAVSQLIIVWIANLPREAAFYVPRAVGGWRYLAALLIFGHFIVPFLLLLSRPWKERSAFVAALGGWIVLMHSVDMYWLIAPSANAAPSPLALGPFLLLSGSSVLIGIVRSSSQPAVPGHEPELARSLGYESP
ncbi:MAG TPA: hypothetical protein VGL19_20750 [Polyangiaceae bacterium]